MANFIRRFLADPGIDVLIEIESVNILDLEPPAAITGIGSGTAMIAGEFENGPFNVATEVTGPDDLRSTFGSFGYTYGGTAGQNPCARSRMADGTPTAEFWNGNGMAQLSGKRFARLVIVRADTSVGSVQWTRLASVLGVARPTYTINTGDTLSFDRGGGALTATFTAVAAILTGAGATYANVGGESITLQIDGLPQFTAVFLSTDTTVGTCVSRINQYAGYTLASNSGGQIRLTSRQLGSAALVKIVSYDAGGTAAKLGLPGAPSTTNGSGNVANSQAVTFAELKTVVEAAVASSLVDQLPDGTPRVSNLLLPGTGTFAVVAPQTATNFGFVVGTTNNSAVGNVGTIPAGTVVKTAGGVKYVTMQDVSVASATAGPYLVKVRHALDDGTGAASLAVTITVVDSVSPVTFDSFAVTNALPTTAALTESQIDAAYTTALNATTDINTVAKEVNLSWCARQSNAVRRAGKQNSLDASANGCFGRMFFMRPPLGTTKATAQGNAEPGVGPYRDQRVVYNYPGVRTLLPAMAAVGTAGGAGFTADGILDVGADGFCASVCSQLAPEENPGQDAGLLGNIVGVESSVNAQGFTIGDYKNFRAKGICAPRIDAGIASFQSGVTSVDPSVFPNLRNIARRRMADFIQDTLANALKGFGKKLSTIRRRNAIIGQIRGFLNGLLAVDNGAAQRIGAFSVLTGVKAGNTLETLGLGIYRVKIAVQTLSSLDSIVLQTTIGESVDVSEAA